MKLSCPFCGSAIAARDINVQSLHACCIRCGKVFYFTPPGGMDNRGDNGKPVIEKPRWFSVSHDGDTLIITFTWSKDAAYGSLVVTCIWNGFLFFVLTHILSAMLAAQYYLMIMVILVFFVVPGIYLIYTTLVLLLNRMTISVNNRTVEVQHSPLPWLGNTVIVSAQIEQVFCNLSSGLQLYNNRREGFDVLACMKNGECVKLISGLERPTHALFVEQEIEQHLGIPDQPVVGEIRLTM